jgi:hypothetical protein
MKAFRWTVAGLFCLVSSGLVAGESNRVIVSHYESLQTFSLHKTAPAPSDGSRSKGSASLSFYAYGKSFGLELVPNRQLLAAISATALSNAIEIYRGRLSGNPDSWARIVVYDGVPRGTFWDGKELYAIEAPGDSIVKADSPVIFRLSDTYIAPGTMTCGSDSLSGNGAVVYSRLVTELNTSLAQGPGAVSEIDIGAVSDGEFTTAQGGDTAAVAAMTDRLSRVDGIYSQEIGVQVNVPVFDTFADAATDPFDTGVDASNETDSSALLTEVRTYRANTPTQSALGLTHLWTGRDLAGSTVGIAYNDVLCEPAFGAGLSEGNSSPFFDSLIAAHEIGHNFGAPHDGDPNFACASEPDDTYIMAPMLNGSTQFSPCSKSIMQASAAAASCVVPLPAVDMSVDLPGQSSTVFLGTNPLLVFEVSSNGTLQATNVTADFTVPGNLLIDAVSSSAGSCTSGAGTVNCIFGDFPGLTVQTVTIDTTAATVGSGTVSAVVDADTDDRPVNNQFSMTLNVDPAVDLVVNSPSTITVTLDQSATIRATLENRAVLDATGVTLSISFGSRVRADSATWSIGSCTVAAQQVDCQAANFASQSNSTLTIGVTGLTSGAQNYSMTMASNENEADPSNNTINGVVTVNDPADESSGGAMGLPFLGLLGWLAFMIRRRSVIF